MPQMEIEFQARGDDGDINADPISCFTESFSFSISIGFASSKIYLISYQSVTISH